MRTMMKKSGTVAALTVAVLVMALLITTGCQEPPLTVSGLQESGVVDSSVVSTNPEKGVVRLNFGDNTGKRTVMPTNPGFVRIELGFTHTSNPLYSQSVPITGTPIAMPTTISPAIELEPGDYTMTVIAYSAWASATVNTPIAFASTVTGGGIIGDKPVAGGGFSIVADQTTNIDVELKPSPLGETGEEGTLSWVVNITGVTNIAAANMTIRNYASPSAQVGGIVPLQIQGTANRDLPSGYYWIDFSITNLIGEKIIARDLAHIYYNMTSPLSITFTDADFYPAVPSQSGEIKYLHPQDMDFDIMVEEGASANSADGDGTPNNRIKLSLNDVTYPRDVILTLVNASEYTSYTWQYGGTILANTIPLGVDVDSDYFDKEGDCMITLIGMQGGVPYTMRIYFHIYN